MAFNGSGTFERIYNWVNDKANGIKIVASRMDGEFDGIATGLSNCITKDGQTTITQNIPFNSKKITGLANGTDRTDVINVGQVQDNQFNYWGTTGGSADAYTLTPSPTITAYATTQQFTAKISATNATTTPYLQISGIANPASTAVIKKLNASRAEIAVEASDLLADGIYTFQRNSANNAWILLNPEKPFVNLVNGTGYNVRATTTAQGIIEIATDAEVQTSVDTERAIVPSALAALFNNSDYTSADFILNFVSKNSGALNRKIIIQFKVGSVISLGASSDTTQAFTYKSAFPTAVIGVIPFVLASGANPTGFINTVEGVGTTAGGTFRIFNSSGGSSSGAPACLAFGY